jgi:hypothetical protein
VTWHHFTIGVLILTIYYCLGMAVLTWKGPHNRKGPVTPGRFLRRVLDESTSPAFDILPFNTIAMMVAAIYIVGLTTWPYWLGYRFWRLWQRRKNNTGPSPSSADV